MPKYLKALSDKPEFMPAVLLSAKIRSIIISLSALQKILICMQLSTMEAMWSLSVLLKMDFLGLKTLSIIKDAIENIKKSKGIELILTTFPLMIKKHLSFSATGRQPEYSSLNQPG